MEALGASAMSGWHGWYLLHSIGRGAGSWGGRDAASERKVWEADGARCRRAAGWNLLSPLVHSIGEEGVGGGWGQV
eukprot:358171-Chlamydomonas_euryale.AAC.2